MNRDPNFHPFAGRGRFRPAVMDEAGMAYPVPVGADYAGLEGYGADESGADDLGADDDLDLDDIGADDFGADVDDKIERAERKITKAKRRYQGMHGMFQKARKQRLLKKIERAEDDLRSLKRSKRNDAAALQAAIGSATGAQQVANSRQGVQGRASAITPAQAAAIRAGQAQNGMSARYVAPPGSGRLVRLPFYGTVAPTSLPRSQFTAGAPGLTAGANLTTEDVSYAVARIVGFVAQVQTALQSGAASAASSAYVEDLKTQGNANLFLHENPADASMYDTDVPNLVGLRSYPILRSPNRGTVTGSAFVGVANDLITLSCALVLDVTEDDVFGPGVPGPYAG